MIPDTIQLITSIGALLLGGAYVLGGLIVNLHLSNYGVTEYQIVRVKYLVVGLIYMINVIIITILGAALGTFWLFIVPAVTQVTAVSLFIASMLGSLILIAGGITRKEARLARLFGKSPWIAMWMFGALSMAYPVIILVREQITGARDLVSGISVAGAILITFVALLGQIYYYSRYIYGNPSTYDPIGMGIPVMVKLAGHDKDISLLAHMGIPSEQLDTTQPVMLVDETDSHYIIGVDIGPQRKVFKVNKELVKGIVYLS